MDYPRAIIAVRQAAAELSRFVGAGVRRVRRDAYEVLGVERGADERAIKKAFRVVARELHPDVNSDDPEAEAKFKEAAEAYEVLSDPERKAVYDRHGWDGVDSKGYASQAQGFGSFADIFDAFFGGDPFGGGRGGPRAVQGGDVGVEVEITPRGGRRAGPRWRCPTTRSSRASTATATAPSPARRSRPATAAAAPASCAPSATPPSASWSAPRPATSAAARARSPRPRAASAPAAGARRAAGRCRWTCPRASPTASACA